MLYIESKHMGIVGLLQEIKFKCIYLKMLKMEMLTCSVEAFILPQSRRKCALQLLFKKGCLRIMKQCSENIYAHYFITIVLFHRYDYSWNKNKTAFYTIYTRMTYLA